MRGEADIERLAKRLPGRRAFITGAASGLGRAFALELARHGWQLGLADLSAERLEHVRDEVGAAGGRASTYLGDVSSPAFVDAVCVAPENPENATVRAMPGTSSSMFAARCTTLSVRSSEAPSGSCTTTMA